MATLTVDDLAEFLNITWKDSTDADGVVLPDPRRRELGEHLAAAVALVEARTGPIWQREATYSVRSVGGLLLLPVIKLAELTSVVGPDGEVELASLDGRVDLHAGMIYLPTFGAGVARAPYVVTVVAGQVEPDADLVRAVLYVAGHLWESQRGRASRPGALGEERTGPGWAIPYVAQTLMEPHLLPVDARSV